MKRIDAGGHRQEPWLNAQGEVTVKTARYFLWLLLCFCSGPAVYAQNNYPIILAHGLGGSEKILDIYPYWGNADVYMRERGFNVYVPSVTPYNSSYARGEELAEKIRNYLVSQGAQCVGELGVSGLNCTTKVHIIGHSQGGLDARHVAKLAGPGMVRSVLTVATPHQGACLASELILINGLGFNFLEFLVNLFGRYTYDADQEGSRPIDARAAAQFLDPFNASCLVGDCSEHRDINVFNAEHPLESGIDYFSVRAATVLPRLPFIPTGWMTGSCGGFSGRGIWNDGLVELESQALGNVLCYRAPGLRPACFNCSGCANPLLLDHLDEIGTPLTFFNHREFYLSAARWLKELPE
ncbi:MAG: hypothetical protein HYR55_10575 [Acidobacteria bacterium]|nr:hypothetical protein [Acidobacteriota bacterium]MBI3654921.1 hypothetical protein [Acidobacteriota bacterium]